MKSQLACALALLAATPVAVAEVPFLVGVLESLPRADPADSARPRVRVVFRHAAAGWAQPGNP